MAATVDATAAEAATALGADETTTAASASVTFDEAPESPPLSPGGVAASRGGVPAPSTGGVLKALPKYKVCALMMQRQLDASREITTMSMDMSVESDSANDSANDSESECPTSDEEEADCDHSASSDACVAEEKKDDEEELPLIAPTPPPIAPNASRFDRRLLVEDRRNENGIGVGRDEEGVYFGDGDRNYFGDRGGVRRHRSAERGGQGEGENNFGDTRRRSSSCQAGWQGEAGSVLGERFHGEELPGRDERLQLQQLQHQHQQPQHRPPQLQQPQQQPRPPGIRTLSSFLSSANRQQQSAGGLQPRAGAQRYDHPYYQQQQHGTRGPHGGNAVTPSSFSTFNGDPRQQHYEQHCGNPPPPDYGPISGPQARGERRGRHEAPPGYESHYQAYAQREVPTFKPKVEINWQDFSTGGPAPAPQGIRNSRDQTWDSDYVGQQKPRRLDNGAVHAQSSDRARRGDHERSADDPGAPLDASATTSNRSMHSYDSKGRCVHHPHVRLRKKKMLGRGWKVLLSACPDCCVDELRRVKAAKEGRRREREERRSSLARAAERAAVDARRSNDNYDGGSGGGDGGPRAARRGSDRSGSVHSGGDASNSSAPDVGAASPPPPQRRSVDPLVEANRALVDALRKGQRPESPTKSPKAAAPQDDDDPSLSRDKFDPIPVKTNFVNAKCRGRASGSGSSTDGTASLTGSSVSGSSTGGGSILSDGSRGAVGPGAVDGGGENPTGASGAGDGRNAGIDDSGAVGDKPRIARGGTPPPPPPRRSPSLESQCGASSRPTRGPSGRQSPAPPRRSSSLESQCSASSAQPPSGARSRPRSSLAAASSRKASGRKSPGPPRRSPSLESQGSASTAQPPSEAQPGPRSSLAAASSRKASGRQSPGPPRRSPSLESVHSQDSIRGASNVDKAQPQSRGMSSLAAASFHKSGGQQLPGPPRRSPSLESNGSIPTAGSNANQVEINKARPRSRLNGRQSPGPPPTRSPSLESFGRSPGPPRRSPSLESNGSASSAVSNANQAEINKARPRSRLNGRQSPGPPPTRSPSLESFGRSPGPPRRSPSLESNGSASSAVSNANQAKINKARPPSRLNGRQPPGPPPRRSPSLESVQSTSSARSNAAHVDKARHPSGETSSGSGASWPKSPCPPGRSPSRDGRRSPRVGAPVVKIISPNDVAGERHESEATAAPSAANSRGSSVRSPGPPKRAPSQDSLRSHRGAAPVNVTRERHESEVLAALAAAGARRIDDGGGGFRDDGGGFCGECSTAGSAPPSLPTRNGGGSDDGDARSAVSFPSPPPGGGGRSQRRGGFDDAASAASLPPPPVGDAAGAGSPPPPPRGPPINPNGKELRRSAQQLVDTASPELPEDQRLHEWDSMDAARLRREARALLERYEVCEEDGPRASEGSGRRRQQRRWSTGGRDVDEDGHDDCKTKSKVSYDAGSASLTNIHDSQDDNETASLAGSFCGLCDDGSVFNGGLAGVASEKSLPPPPCEKDSNRSQLRRGSADRTSSFNGSGKSLSMAASFDEMGSLGGSFCAPCDESDIIPLTEPSSKKVSVTLHRRNDSGASLESSSRSAASRKKKAGDDRDEHPSLTESYGSSWESANIVPYAGLGSRRVDAASPERKQRRGRSRDEASLASSDCSGRQSATSWRTLDIFDDGSLDSSASASTGQSRQSSVRPPLIIHHPAFVESKPEARRREPRIADGPPALDDARRKSKRKSKSKPGDKQKDPRETMHAIQMPYADSKGRSGVYNGMVDMDFVPHGNGTMTYENGVVKDGDWRKGRYRRGNAQGKTGGSGGKIGGSGSGSRRRRPRETSGSLIVVPVEDDRSRRRSNGIL